jgi:hypothetical protein
MKSCQNLFSFERDQADTQDGNWTPPLCVDYELYVKTHKEAFEN